MASASWISKHRVEDRPTRNGPADNRLHDFVRATFRSVVVGGLVVRRGVIDGALAAADALDVAGAIELHDLFEIIGNLAQAVDGDLVLFR